MTSAGDAGERAGQGPGVTRPDKGKTMDSKQEYKQEQISALIDGQLAADELDQLLQQMNEQEQENWGLYQQIGALLRKEEEAPLSAGFAAKMAARLAQEEAHQPQAQAAPATAPVAPQLAQATPAAVPAAPSRAQQAAPQRRWTLATLAAIGGAILASLGILGGQQLMLAQADQAAPRKSAGVLDSTQKPVVLLASTGGSNLQPVAQTAKGTACVERHERVIADGQQENFVMLRDPEIDQYLMAHQPSSLYSTTQYARTATFAGGSKK